MNTMQKLAIKYPTLWEHIAKGGKVRGFDDSDIEVSSAEVLMSICAEADYPFEMIDERCYKNIEQIPLPKRVPTKDLGKAVNWFEENWEVDVIVYRKGRINIDVGDIRQIVQGIENTPDWWPEELMEDENND